MTMQDVTHLSAQLQALYGERFVGLTQALAVMWLDDLRGVDPEIMDQAVTRWVRQHHIGQAPTLQNLVDTVELVEDDRRARQTSRRSVTSPSTPEVSFEAVLAHAAALQTGEARLWAQGHCEILERGLGRPSNHRETAAFCRVLAQSQPMLAANWEREACWWEHASSGAVVLDREPGEEG